MRLTSVIGLVLVAAPLAAQNPPGSIPMPATDVYPTPLYRMADVGKALTLTPDQMTRLNAATEQTQTRYRDNYTGLGKLGDEERATRMRELNGQYTNDWNKATRDVFTDDQRTRYQQLHYQYGGFDALHDTATQTRLGLTPDQIKNLGTHSDWSAQQYRDLNRIGATDATRGTQMYTDYWTQRQDRMNKYLTPAQQKSWGEMTGEAYKFQPAFGPRR